MTTKSLKNILVSIEKKLETIPYVNCGGCGWVFLITVKELRKRNIPFVAVIDGPSFYDDWQDNSFKFNLYSNNFFTCRHIYLRIDGYNFNEGISIGYLSEITIVKNQQQITKLCKKLKESMFMYNWDYYWNTVFDRKNMPKIKKIIVNEFKKLDDGYRNQRK